MSLTERIYGKETAGKPAVSSDTQKNLYTAAANKKPSLANRIAQNGGQPTLYTDAAAKQKPSLASRIEANGGTPYADAAAQAKQSGTQSLYAQAAKNISRGENISSGSPLAPMRNLIDDRESTVGSGKYADILKASDYAALSKAGESKAGKLFGDARYDYINDIGDMRIQHDVSEARGQGAEYSKYALMTQDEVGVYNYLYATQGKKAANAFLSDLEPELDKQWYSGLTRGNTEVLGKNAGTRALASTMTVLAQPARTLSSMIAMADDAVRTAKGQEINPYSQFRRMSNITQDLRADTSQHIEETNPGMGGKVGSFVYNTAMSAADSAMNALVAKGIGEAVGLTGDTLMKATNILGSALMSSEAASLSIAESKEKGYSNAGALALGLTRGAIEYASEAVGGEWVIRKIKANPLSFVKSMALTMIPEGMEEVMSDAANGVVNLAIDAAFGTEESGIPKMLEYYRTSGTDWQKKHAELATVLAVLGQEGLSFLGGALATLGSSGVQYSTNRANINQTAERLDATPKNVVQMMQDAQTENPGVIYALAELTDAENADDLRRKIGTKEDMKRAAEYLTQQMEAGGRSGAQEGTYTAGAKNAPVGAQRAQNEVTIPQSAAPTAPFAQGSRNMKGEFGNGQSTYQGRENGYYDLRTGGQAAAEGGAQALAGGRAEIPGGVGADAQADLRQVTPAQLGIRNGGTEAVTVVDAQKLGGDAARAYNLLAANNIEPVAVRGAIQVNNGYANAYTESGKVFFRVDAVDSRGNAISPEALVRHELFHNYISEEVLQTSDEVIRESMTAEEYDAMYESYRDAYASIYDFENMSEDEIERLLTEEIAADAYAGLNWFSGDAPVQEAVRAETERNAPARRAEAQQETTGPPEGQGAVYIEKSKSALESNPNSNAYVLASSIPLLQNLEVVKHLTGEELNDASKPLDQQISDLFASVGNVAHREGFGKVELNRYGVDGIINHKPNRSKVLGVAAIKEVIEKGYIIKTNLNWKGRGYDSYMIAAPVGLGDATVYVAAVVNRDQGTNKFYLDEVVDQDGNYINIKNEAPGNTKTGVTVQDGVTRGPKASSDAIVHSDTGNSQEKSSGRASIVVLPDGKKYVQADRQVIFGDDPDGWADQIEGYINRKIRNGEDVILTTDSGDVLKITKDTAGKASFRNFVRDENGTMRRMTDAEYEAKLNAEAHIDELAQISERINKKPRKDETARNGQPIHGELARNGWIYRKAEFQDFDGQRYRVTISTPDGNNGVVVYNVGKMQRRGSPAIKYGSSDSVTETGAQQGKSSSTVTIRQTEGNSQEKSSGKASVEVSGINNRTAAELRREYERRMQEYQKATQRDDQSFPYIDEMKWMQAAERRLAELGDGKHRHRTVGSTKRDIMQLFSTDRANRTDVERVLNRNIGEMMAQGEIRGDALDTLVNELLQTGSVMSSSKNSPWIDETYESIRSDLKGSKLYVSKDMWRDFSKDEARELRERARAAGITLSDNRRYTPPDVRNIELAEKYGEALFPTDISAPDMLRNIIYCAEQGANEKQTLADRLWDEAQQEGLGEAREHAYERMVNDLRDKTEVILREFAEDNHMKLKEQTKTKAKPVSYFDLKKAPAKEFDRKKGDYNIIGEIGSYTKEIAELENALETENRYVISEGEARYEARIEEENGVLYASVWKNGERLAGASSRKRKNLPNWAAMEIRKDVGARIMFHPGLENRGESYNADLKAAEEAGYPMFEKKNGEKVQTVPFWTWLKSKEYGNYGLVIDKTNAQDADGNPIVFAYYFNKKKGTGKVVMESRETAYVVDGKYSDPDAAEKRAARMKDEESEAMRAEEREALWRETQKGSPFEAQPNATTDTRERVTKATSAGVQRLFQQLISKGKTEVSTQGESGIRTYTAKMNTNGVEYWVDISDGRQDVQRFREFEKEKAAQLAAEWMDKEANRAYTAANEKRAEARRAELSAEENAKIAELFGNAEELKTAETPEDAPSPGETAESRVTDEIVKAEKSFRESLADVTHGAMRMFVNAGETVRRISKQTKNKSLEGYYFNAGAYSQRAGNWIAKGGARTDISGHKTGESLMDILGDIMKTPEKYKDFQLMLLHRNNVDRMRYDSTEEVQNLTKCVTTIEDLYPKLRGLDNDYLYQTAVPGDKRDMLSREWKETVLDELLNGEMPEIADISEAAQMLIFTRQKISEAKKNGLKPVFGYEVTAYDSQLEAERLLKANPEFDALAKRVYAYFDDLLQYRIDAGLDTQKHVEAMKKRYPNYVPTMRVEGTEGKTARRARRNGGIVVSNAIGRAVGGDAVIMPLHTAMSRKTVAVMKNAGLNQFGEQLVQSWNQDKSIPGVNKVDLVDYSSTDQYVDSEELYVPVTNNVFSVLRGNDRYNITMDEGLAQALNAFQPDKYANSDIAKLLKKGNDLFKALCTGYNPIFMVRNLVRDAQDAAFYSTDSATWAKMFPSAWKQIVTNGEIWQQYKALGGSYVSMLDYTTGMVKEPKSAAGKLAAKYESLGQAIEAAPRLAEFMTILANKGGSKTADGVKTGKFTQSDLMEAMLGAADITTNFARGGTVTKMLNKYLVPFLNPSVQGADKFVRNITDRKGFKAWASLAIKAAALGILPELLNGLLYRDDDEWDDIPDQTKSNYYLFKLGDGYWMKIPRGRALAVFSAGATYAQEKAKGNAPKFSDVIEVVKSNVAPTDIFNQNIATAWTQTKLFNPDNPGTTWYGGNIESDRLQNYRPGERYDEKTDELSKWIGKTFNLSPKKINYLLDQYSGVVGDLLLPWFTPSATASSPALAPLKQAFMLDSTSTNKTTGEYYDLLDDLKYDANDGDIGAGITRKYVSHAGDEVNDYYQQIRAIQSDENLTKAEKNRLVRALKSQLIERQKEIIAQAEPYREAVSDYLKAHPELSTDNDAAIAEYAELYGITEDQAESRMDAIVYREANREVFGAEYALRTYNADVYDKARAAYAKGVSYETYYDYYFATKEMHADKDENGKSISGSKKAKVVEFINSLDIPPEQKDALYVAAGYTAKSARNQKWNGGSGGSGGRRGRGKRTALKAPTPKAPEIIIQKSGTASSAKAGGTSKTPKVSGNVIADFTKTASGTDIQKAVTQAKRKALKAGNRTVYVEEGSPIDYFLKYGKLPSLK